MADHQEAAIPPVPCSKLYHTRRVADKAEPAVPAVPFPILYRTRRVADQPEAAVPAVPRPEGWQLPKLGTLHHLVMNNENDNSLKMYLCYVHTHKTIKKFT